MRGAVSDLISQVRMKLVKLYQEDPEVYVRKEVRAHAPLHMHLYTCMHMYQAGQTPTRYSIVTQRMETMQTLH